MAGLPSKIVFACEDCSAKFKPAKLRKSAGVCSNCGAATWSMNASYVDRERKTSITGTASLIAFGIGWDNVKTYTSEFQVQGLARETVIWMTEEKKEVELRIAEFIRKNEVLKLKEEGRINCSSCNILFQPVDHKSWTQAGFCSANCAMTAGHAVKHKEVRKVGGKHPLTDASASSVVVTCTKGHEFPVMRSFSGCKRPCPICSEKCLVP